MALRTTACPLYLLALLISVAASSAEDQKPAPALPKISTNDNRTPAGDLRNGVLVLRLELREGRWYPQQDGGEAITVYSFGEEARGLKNPGPLIRVPEGTEIRATIHNLLPVTATIHGLHGRPGDEKEVLSVAAGATQETRFQVGTPGTYVYWGTTTGMPIQRRAGIDTQLSGALIVDPRRARPQDRVFVIGYWYKDLLKSTFRQILTINGKSWPYTEHFTFNAGDAVHWRWINPSVSDHAMHLHGFYYRVDAVGDGERTEMYSDVTRRRVNTEHVEQGHTFDMTWVPERAGNWIFHCHMLMHMTDAPFLAAMPTGSTVQATHEENPGAAGMSGLVLGITVLPGESEQQRFLPPARRLHLLVRERAASTHSGADLAFQLEPAESHDAGPSVPGPPILLTRGEPVEITVSNELKQPTAIHWHGIELESYFDGVPGWGGSSRQTTPPILPGESFIAKMAPPRAGTFIYHTHWHDVEQLTGGLYGPLIVLEPGQKFDPDTDKIFIISRGGPDERVDPLLLNGAPQPRRLIIYAGRKYRFRFINITPNDSDISVSLLTEGALVKWRAVAKDGDKLPPEQETQREARQVVTVGETYDFEFQPEKPGEMRLEVLAPFLKVRLVQALVVLPAVPQ